jgi:hypothetical protein
MTYRVPTVFYRFDYVVHPFAVSWRQAYQAFQFRVAELESSVLDLVAVSLSSGVIRRTDIDQQIVLAVSLLGDNLIRRPGEPTLGSQGINLLQGKVRLEESILAENVQRWSSLAF